jgi:uncharacterized membrane protein YgdD (TMEM256/DUF423 family)
MNKKCVLTGSILICLAIMLGAFGAHGIRDHVSADLLDSWETATTYQFYAGFALLIVGLAADKLNIKLRPFYLLHILGVILFCFGIYLYCLHEVVPSFKPAIHFVPIGGVSFIVAWIILIVSLIREKGAK